MVPFLLFLLLAVPSPAQGYATIYSHSAAFGPDVVIPGDVTIGFSDGTATDFECRLDAGGWTACSNPKTYTGLADGPHDFGVRTLGDTSVATFSWVTDNTGPVATIDSGPEALTTSTSASFSFHWTDLHPDGGYVLCSLDANPLNSACTSPKTFNNLEDGNHRLNVAAVDGVGNVSETAVYEWTIDTTAPNTQITSHPPASTYETSADFTLDSFPEPPPRDKYECSLDDSPYTACARSKSYSGLAPGSHTFSARAIDRVGLVDPTPASWTWTVLETPPAPDTAITDGPSGTVASTTALFYFSSPTPSVSFFACSLDGSEFVPCSEGYYTGLSEGSHTFAVRAVNSLGTPDPTPATRTWTIDLTPDTTPPDTAISAGPSGTTSDATPTFEFTSEAGASFECRVDAGAFSACTSPKTVAVLTDGAHTFEVRATDGAGNTDPTPATRTFTVNTSSPAGKALISGVTVTGPARLKQGTMTTYKVEVTNSGDADATGVILQTSVGGKKLNDLRGNITAKSSRIFNVKVRAPKTGKLTLTFAVTSSNAGGKTVKKKVTVTT